MKTHPKIVDRIIEGINQSRTICVAGHIRPDGDCVGSQLGLTQSLRRFQDEVNEVRAGMECGIRIEGFGDFQMGDNIECYAVEKVAQKL